MRKQVSTCKEHRLYKLSCYCVSLSEPVCSPPKHPPPPCTHSRILEPLALRYHVFMLHPRAMSDQKFGHLKVSIFDSIKEWCPTRLHSNGMHRQLRARDMTTMWVVTKMTHSDPDRNRTPNPDTDMYL